MSTVMTAGLGSEAGKAAETLFAALIPLEGINLLLPNALVATTLGLDSLTPPQAAPEWLAGSVRVYGQRLAVLRFEMLSNSSAAFRADMALNRRSRIVVLRASAVTPAFAVVATAAPRLINVNALVLKPLALLASDVPAYCACRVQLGHTEVLIPNVDALAAAAQGW